MVFCLLFSLHILQSICLLCCCILPQQPNFPTGIHKVSSYLFMTIERDQFLFAHSFTCSLFLSVIVFTLQELCSFYRMSKSPKSRSDAAGNLQVSSYRRKRIETSLPPILQTPHRPPPPSSEKGLKSRSNWFGLHFNSMSSLFPSCSPSSLPSLFSLSGEAQRTGMSMYKHGGEKTKTLEQTNVASMSFFLFIVFFSSIIVTGCSETGDGTNMHNTQINWSQLNSELNGYSGEIVTRLSLVWIPGLVRISEQKAWIDEFSQGNRPFLPYYSI